MLHEVLAAILRQNYIIIIKLVIFLPRENVVILPHTVVPWTLN